MINTSKSVFVKLLLIVTVILLLTRTWLAAHQVDVYVLGAANFLLFLVTLLSSGVTAKSFANPNVQASVRAVMLSFMIKFFVLALAAFVYIFVQRKAVNLPALIGAAFLYVLYAGVEVRLLLRALKR
jgi:hypothetical protein